MIKRISHGLGLDMIFFQLIECFLFPRQAQDRKYTTCCHLIKIIQPKTIGDPIYVDIELIPEMVYPGHYAFQKIYEKIKF